MLSIARMASGQSAYYLGLAREDYYLEDGGEPPGLWHGQGAAHLGLAGIVAGPNLNRLFAGHHPRTNQPLIEIQGRREHHTGWDLTFSAPKSVSVLWSQAGPDTRQAIQEAQLAAVRAALGYLEDTCEVARRGKGGVHHERAKLVFATFEHGTSRAQDPQLHTHCLALNVGVRLDGTFGTLDSDPLFRAKMTAGALYRAEMARQLENRLGVEVRRDGIYFAAKGVPVKLCDDFSKRRSEIKEAMQAKGFATPEAAAVAALSTRSAKAHASREDLFRDWSEVGKTLGWGRAQAESLLWRAPVHHNPERELLEAVQAATAQVTAQQSFFTDNEFLRRLAEEGPGRGLGAQVLRQAARETLFGNAEIVPLGQWRGSLVFTTREVMALEKSLLSAVEQSRRESGPAVSDQVLNGVIRSRKTFSEEQAGALRHIAGKEGGGRIRLVSGMAGTGKTTLLHAARLAWELEGYEVHGAALSGKAAQGLQEGSGIASGTIHKTLFDLKAGRLALHGRSILVVDEAGMVGTRPMASLVEATRKAGATLILVGDARQLQPIESGGPFPEMTRRLGAAALSEIRRQREKWARESVSDFAAGRAQEALKAYAERGLLHISEEPGRVHQELVSHWKTTGINQPQDQLIFTGTRHDAAILNGLAQSERQKAGALSRESVVSGSENLHTGDRLLFTRNARTYGVRNGSLGEVTEVFPERRALSVRLDGGDLVRLSLNDYPHVQLGYAVTTHKGQGVTVERAYVLAGGTMQDREITYVQASRARGETRIFADREAVGEDLCHLVRQMHESRAKEIAHVVERQGQRERPRADFREHPRPAVDNSPDIGF